MTSIANMDSTVFSMAGTALALGTANALDGSIVGLVFAILGAAVFLLPDDGVIG